MMFQRWTGVCRVPVCLLFFINAQLMPGLAASALTQAFDGKGNSAGGLHRLIVTENPESSEYICPTELGAAIDAVIDRPQFRRTHWGILIEPLSPNAFADQSRLPSRVAEPRGLNRTSTVNPNPTLYSRDAQRYFIPASNVKLLTTAAALLQLGSEFRIRTSVYDAGAGSLRVVGRGDPSLTQAQLKDLAQQLKRRGVRNVPKLIVDDGYFQGEVVNLSWDWEDVQSDYGASVNSLILNQNAVELTLSPQQVGEPLRIRWSDSIAALQWQIVNNSVTVQRAAPASVAVTRVLGKPLLQIRGQLAIDSEPQSFGLAVLDPGEYFIQHFQNALAAEGITVGQAFVVSSTPVGDERELAAVESPTLATLLLETNQESNNLYAEVLLRSLGTKVGGAGIRTVSTDSTAKKGLNLVKATLTELGIDPESYVLVDGSGLSRQNLVSPEAIAQTLKLMAQTPQAAAYRASLPTAGITGTLGHRFRNTVAQGNLQAKTGTMNGVSALSGYLDIPGPQLLVFSIMVNQSDQSVATLRQAIDEIVLLLTRLHLHSCQVQLQ